MLEIKKFKAYLVRFHFMTADQEPSPPQRSFAPDIEVKHDRRRPGRVKVDPALLPLLRGTAPLVEPLPAGPDQGFLDFKTKPGITEQAHLANLDDGGNPARGILLAFLLALPVWAVAVAICYWLIA